MTYLKLSPLLWLLTCVLSESDILVRLPTGIIRGKNSFTYKNKTFFSFLKVPYASPPIGELRFQPPTPPKNWSGILDTTTNTAVCYQVSKNLATETEDCLYLNIYTPQLPSGNNNVSLPVIFYIHGGGFYEGTCLEDNCGADFFIEHDVVVVTVNYRLGPFGFLSIEDEIIPGNNGLKDQQLGLQWTHDNIGLFGGDPGRITLVGQSAGAASVTYLMLNEKSKGLFWGAICQSGSFLSPWSFQRKPKDVAFKTASFINETFTTAKSSKELLEFLLSVSAEVLDAASNQVLKSETSETWQLSQGYFYAPVIEVDHKDAIITKKMFEELKSGNFIKVPTIIGITSEECLEENGRDLNLLKEQLTSFDKNLSLVVPNDLNIDNLQKRKTIGELIRRIYTNSEFQENFATGINYFSDTEFTRSVIKHAELQSQFTDVYFYQFSYDGKLGNISYTVDGAGKVAHSEDRKYIWKMDYDNYNNTNIDSYPTTDVAVHNIVLQLFTNFAKTLNPTPNRSDVTQNVLWPKFTSDQLYLDIDESLEVKNYPRLGTYLAWNRIYDSFGEGRFDTY